MKEAVISILKEYDGEIEITDFDVNYKGALITDVILTADEQIQFWSGNPDFSHSAEILPDEETIEYIYELILDSF